MGYIEEWHLCKHLGEGPKKTVAVLPKAFHGKPVLTPLRPLHAGQLSLGVVQEKVDDGEVGVEGQWGELVFVELDGGDSVAS